jgi:hypothetical protein
MKNSSGNTAPPPSGAIVIANSGVETVRQDTLARVKETYQNASMDTLRKRGDDESIAAVEKIMSRMDILKPETIATVGSDAFADPVDAGHQLVALLEEKDSSATAIAAVDNLNNTLNKSCATFQQEVDARAGRGKIAQGIGKFPMGRRALEFIDNGKIILTTGHQKKRLQEINGAYKESQAMSDLLHDSADLVRDVSKQLALSKDGPANLQKNIMSIVEKHEGTGQKLLLTLIAVNEFEKKLRNETLPQLCEKMNNPDCTVLDFETYEAAQEALKLAETRRTDLMAGLVNVHMQRGMALEIRKINLRHITEIERLQQVVMPQIYDILGSFALQHRSVQTSMTIKHANNVQADVQKASAVGFGRAIKAAADADTAKIKAAQATVESTRKIIADLSKYSAHLASLPERQKEVQKGLIEVVTQLVRETENIPNGRIGDGTSEKRRDPPRGTLRLDDKTL